MKKFILTDETIKMFGVTLHRIKAVTLHGRELILGGQDKPVRNQGTWNVWDDIIELPKGSIKKLIGRELTWNDEPVELK